MLQPQNQNKKYDHLFSAIDQGYIKIPIFQREFVWSKSQTAQLIDSILKGFPIGTFIFWETKEDLRHIKNIGNINLPEVPQGQSVSYILDGQQRITSLYALSKGLRIDTKEEMIDYQDIYINLSTDPDSDEEIVTAGKPEEMPSISVYELLNAGIKDFIRKYDENSIEKIDLYQKRLKGYDFSTILLANYPIDTACEVFTRINTAGKELTLFEIMVAKTYDQTHNFDLAEEYNRLLSNGTGSKDLQDAGFETIPSSTVLQCISAHICKQAKRKDILLLNKYEVIDNWAKVKDGIFSAVDYIRTQMRIPVSKLLPYNTLLVPFSYFFIQNGGVNPTSLQNKMLTQYFWWASLTSRFSSGSEAKIVQDLNRMDDILNEKVPAYRGEEINISLQDLKWHQFSTGDAFCKAILCLYAYFEPKSFESNSIVKIDNSWLKVANSKNYHHFFPKGYLLNNNWEEWKANSILNITIVDDYLNKQKIKAKPPSDYMSKFMENNSEISETMRTHLIDDMDNFGIWTDEYEQFIEQRGQRVIEEINKRLKPDL